MINTPLKKVTIINSNSMSEYLNLPEKNIFKFEFTEDSVNYDKRARLFLQQVKNYFPQLSIFADKLEESLYAEIKSYKDKKLIQASRVVYNSPNFQVIPKSENETRELIEKVQQHVETPEILDILLRFNYIYESFPSLTSILDNLLFKISMQNEYPLIKLAVISQLFSMPSRRVEEKINEFETLDVTFPGEIISCIFDQKNQEISPLTLTNEFFNVEKDSIYIRYYKHDYVFTPSTKTVSFCKTGPKNKVTTKKFSEFLINEDEKVEEIGIFNDQLFFVQQIQKEKLRITFYKKGILTHDIIKKDYIIDLDEEYEKIKAFQNNLMIFMKNGKKCLYNIGKHILIKDTNASHFYFDMSKISIYDKINEVFILPICDNDKLIYQIIKREKKKSNFVQIIPPFYGVKTDEIIMRVSFEFLNLCTEVISNLIDSKTLITTNLVSDPLLHIQYALDLSETIQKNELSHDQNLCDFCLITLTRFIIINIYQLNANNQKLADFQIKRFTRLFSSMKMSVPHFDTLFALVSIINNDIYTKSFISNVFHPFVSLSEDKKFLQAPSFILFIKSESISSMNTKEKMSFLQSHIKNFNSIYNKMHLDEELIPFIKTFFEVLTESLDSKSISNIAICTYINTLIPFLCTMENTPQLSIIILSYLTKNLDKLFFRINSVIGKINKFFDNDGDSDHYSETQTTDILLPEFWTKECDGNVPNSIKSSKKIENESFKFFDELTKDDLLIFLLPNAIINCIQICYKSIEITKDEKDNECYLSYQNKKANSKEAPTTKSSSYSSNLPRRTVSQNTATSTHKEEEFLSSLNEDSILIKRLRKEIKNIFQRNISKEIEEVEILIFKTLLFLSQLIKYAMNVTENSQIIPQIKNAWKTAVKVRTDLRLAKQFETNKKEVHVNLKERYDDYIKSIKEKCLFLLNQNNMDIIIKDTNQWIKQNYSFITSNLPLNKLFTLQEISKKREEIKQKSIETLKKFFKIKMQKTFLRSIVSYLTKNEMLFKALYEDDEFISLLINSDDPFIRLCTFDFIAADKFKETALKLLNEFHEDNPNALKFLNTITEVKQNIDIDVLLEYIGKFQYDIENKKSMNIYLDSCIKKVTKKIDFESLISKIKGFDDISLGVLVVIKSLKSIEEKDLNKFYPILIKLQSQLPNINNDNLKNRIILDLYVSALNLIIKFDYNLFKAKIIPQINISKYMDSIKFQKFINIQISDLIELYHEMKENQQKSSEADQNPYFIQLKGNLESINEHNPNQFNPKFDDYNFYVFSKPIDKKERIVFHFDDPDVKNYILIGAIDIYDEFIGLFPPMAQSITNSNYFDINYPDNMQLFNSFYLMRNTSHEAFSFSFFDDEENCFFDILENNKCDGPIIPFILIFRSNITFSYKYYSDFDPSDNRFKDYDDLSKFNISDLNQIMTIIPLDIIGRKIHVENIGDGVIIKTNDKNDNAEIVLFNDDGIAILADVNLSSEKCQVIKENRFLTLLRSLIISEGFYDMDLMNKCLLTASSMKLSESLLIQLTFTLSNACIQFIFERKDILQKILSEYKSQMISLINENIVEFVNILQPNEDLIIYLIQNDLVNSFELILCINDDKIDFSKVFRSLETRSIVYEKNNIEKYKSYYEKICKKFKLIDFIEIDSFLSLFNDLLKYLLIHSPETVCSNLESIDNKFLSTILYLECNKPTGIPLLIGAIYKSYIPTTTYNMKQSEKFILSMKCQNVEDNSIFEPNIEYNMEKEILLKVIKPEIHNVFDLINKFNETDHIDTFLQLIENKSNLLTYSSEKEKIDSNILFLYMILFEEIKEEVDKNVNELFVMKSLDEKSNWLHHDLPIYNDWVELKLSFSRFQKKLLFDQFYDQIKSKLIELRDDSPFNVTFIGEGGIDAGGPKREVITLIYEELIDTNNNFFEIQDDDYLVPSKSCEKSRLEVVGAFIACCFYSENPHDFHLSPKIWSTFISSSEEEIDECTAALKKGFNIVVPEYNLRYFTIDDLSKLTCGDCLSFEKFIQCCHFYDFSIKNVFTEAVSKFSLSELKRLLQFITGSHTIPFRKSFHINIEFKYSNDNVDESKWPLPVAHTCFHTIDICTFKNANILCDKLKLAMQTEMINDNDFNAELINFDTD